MKPSRHRSQGFFLYEAALAIVLLTTVTFSAVDLTNKAASETSIATSRTLADAYMDREAALMRRLSRSDLNIRGYTSPATTTNSIPLAFYSGPASNNFPWSVTADSNYMADSITRSETSTGVSNSYVYDVGLIITLKSTTLGSNGMKTYSITREVTRNF